jgi:hypothetical protein
MIGRIGIIAAVVAIVVGRQAPSPSESDLRWLDQVREPAFAALIPVKASKALVAYRSWRDLYYDVVERHFIIEFAGGPSGFDKDRLVATVVEPVDRSIQGQLLELHMKNRLASFESVISQVVVRRLVLRTETCPAVRKRMNALSKVSISIPERDVVVLHPLSHRIVVDFAGTHLDATLSDGNAPVVRWATQTIDALRACAG